MEASWLILIFLSILAAAFSSGMEIAFITSNKLKIELDRKQGVFVAGIVGHFVKHTKMYIATMLVGNNIALVIYGMYMGELLTHGFETWIPAFAIQIGELGILLIKTLVSTIVILILGEFIPKALFSINPNRWLNALAVPLMLWYGVLWIFAWIVTGISDIILRIFTGKESKPQVAEFGRIDLDHYLEQVTGNIDRTKDIDHEITIFQNALDFSKVKARDCLIPRNEIVGIEITDTVDKLKELFIETRLSKILVYRESIDHIIGYVHQFELFQKPLHIQQILRPVAIIPEPMPAHEILELFIKQKKSMAVVVDEFGGTAGIITMEDVVEEIFGEIDDEHDGPETTEQRLSDSEYLFSARLEIDYLNDKYFLDLPVNDDEYDTLGGLVLHIYGDIPDEKEVIQHQGFLFQIEKVSDRRIEQVKILISNK
jgi:CBS domain containing-hemolysin-like protein